MQMTRSEFLKKWVTWLRVQSCPVQGLLWESCDTETCLKSECLSIRRKNNYITALFRLYNRKLEINSLDSLGSITLTSSS